MATDNFFRSVSEDFVRTIEASPGALVRSSTNDVRNEALFGRKRQRLYFTRLKSVEVRQSEKTRELESESYVLPDVELFIDPSAINVSKKVIQKRQLTKGGWVVQFWGHDLTTVKIKAVSGFYGVTKGLAPSNIAGIINKGQRKPMQDALKAFEYLKENAYMRRFDKRIPYIGLPVIGMVYDGMLYRGYFESFDYSLDASTPFQITYSFAFTIIPPEDDIAQMEAALDQIPDSLEDAKNITRGVVAGTYLNPSGASSKISNAMSGMIEKSTQIGLDELGKKLGVQSFLDVTPSRVVLY